MEIIYFFAMERAYMKFQVSRCGGSALTILHNKSHPVAYVMMTCSCFTALTVLTFMEIRPSVIAVYKHHAMKTKKRSRDKAPQVPNPSKTSGYYKNTVLLLCLPLNAVLIAQYIIRP
jgi:hypothetical protein